MHQTTFTHKFMSHCLFLYRPRDQGSHLEDDVIKSLVEAEVQEIDLSGSANLTSLPLCAICSLSSVVNLKLDNCPQLVFPPACVRSLSGTGVMTFLRHATWDVRGSSRLENISGEDAMALHQAGVVNIDVSGFIINI
jgi:hypothetical protein